MSVISSKQIKSHEALELDVPYAERVSDRL